MNNKRFEESIRLSYSKTEIVNNIKEIEHRIFRESLRFTDIKKQVEIVSIADVPSNCGLGTSSTFTVALLGALFAYRRNHKTLTELAECACHIEINLLKEPIGKQDQYAAAFGGFNAYTFHKDGNVTVEPVRISEGSMMELQSNIFLFYLNKNRSASAILKVQNKNTKAKYTLFFSSQIILFHQPTEIRSIPKKIIISCFFRSSELLRYLASIIISEKILKTEQ